jgi:hypothetical protein
MSTYYKATRLDGTDFYSGKVDYAAALASDERVWVQMPAGNYPLRLCGPGVLHAATVPAESLVGGSWPCHLFAVKGRPLALDYDNHPHKRGFASLRVVEELPAWQALGPNGQEVVALIERARQMTPSDREEWAAAENAIRGAIRGAAWGAAWDAAWDAAENAARAAARAAAWTAAENAAGAAAGDAAWALVIRDLITDEQYQALAGSWLSVMGEGAETA